MQEYHKIQSVFKRDTSRKKGKFIMGEYATPEIEFLKENIWVWTEKIDGTNIRIYWDGEKVRIGAKTENSQIPVILHNRLAEMFTPEKFTGKDEMILFGEGYGQKIGKAGKRYLSDGVDFILFDVKCGDWWLRRDDVAIVASELGIKAVSVIGSGTIDEAIEFVKKGFKSNIADCQAEGIVLRPAIELFDRGGERIITKLKFKDFQNAEG